MIKVQTMDRTDTAQIGIRRNNIYSLYFGKYEFLIPNIQSIDYEYLRDVFKNKYSTVHIKNLTFSITEDVVLATFLGIEIQKGVWILGNTTEQHTKTLEGVSKEEVYYMVYLILHMFDGPEGI